MYRIMEAQALLGRLRALSSKIFQSSLHPFIQALIQ
jgi:hypothetical protein